MTQDASAADASPASDIVAPPASYYRRTRYLMAILLIGGGLWFAYDGWIGWPRHNQEVRDLKSEIAQAEKTGDSNLADLKVKLSKMDEEHGPLQIWFQKFLAFTLPPAGIALLVWTLYNSRGVYRLSGDTLHVPGHPPIPLDTVRRIDKRLWDRKGIAYIDYELDGAGANAGKVKLDDFVYERKPTDEIYERIERYVTPGGAAGAGEGEPAGEPLPE